MKKFLSIAIIVILIAIIASPTTYIDVCFDAITVWATVLLPSLLPFFIFTKLLTSLGYVKNASNCFGKLMYKIYHTPPISSYAFIMSILTGYPVGSKLIADLYHNNMLSKEDAKKCIAFTSNSGPMFIVGSVGVGMLLSAQAGYILYASHIVGALINGLLYRGKKCKDDAPYIIENNNNNDATLSSCVMDSIFSVLLIGGIVAVAFIIIEILNNLNVFYPIVYILQKIGIDANISTGILGGMLEITKGCIDISSLSLSLYTKTVICSAIISFGGISTVMQSMAFLKDITGYGYFIKQKTTHMIFSTITCAVLSIALI